VWVGILLPFLLRRTGKDNGQTTAFNVNLFKWLAKITARHSKILKNAAGSFAHYVENFFFFRVLRKNHRLIGLSTNGSHASQEYPNYLIFKSLSGVLAGGRMSRC
jgi:hypothetical protein